VAKGKRCAGCHQILQQPDGCHIPLPFRCRVAIFPLPDFPGFSLNELFINDFFKVAVDRKKKLRCRQRN
jgi:hypothetical protein